MLTLRTNQIVLKIRDYVFTLMIGVWYTNNFLDCIDWSSSLVDSDSSLSAAILRISSGLTARTRD